MVPALLYKALFFFFFVGCSQAAYRFSSFTCYHGKSPHPYSAKQRLHVLLPHQLSVCKYLREDQCEESLVCYSCPYTVPPCLQEPGCCYVHCGFTENEWHAETCDHRGT